MVWGRFDAWLVATYAAKDLRTQVRERGIRNAPDEHNASTLERIVREDLRRREPRKRWQVG